jgi:phosphate transport system protein
MAIESRDDKVQDLKDELLVLASMVEQMARHAINALLKRDLEDSQRIYAYDQEVNQKHLTIETRCLDLIAKEPPILALDLRLVASLLEVNTEIERIGDSAKQIAKISLEIIFEPPIIHSNKISRITECILESFHQAIGAFVVRDKQTSIKITDQQISIQNQLNDCKLDILKVMTDNPNTHQNAAKYFWVIHIMEMILDHVINICKRTMYLETGKLPTIEYHLEWTEST